jgi:hypothetical protein
VKKTLTQFFDRISGVSTPFVGISWIPPIDERQTIYRLLQRMGDRRLIRHYHGGFEYSSVVSSLNTMRSNLTEALAELSPESKVRPLLEDMRTTLHAFQDLVEAEYPRDKFDYEAERAEAGATEEVLEALNAVRHAAGDRILQLSEVYNIPLSKNLIDGLALSS